MQGKKELEEKKEMRRTISWSWVILVLLLAYTFLKFDPRILLELESSNIVLCLASHLFVSDLYPQHPLPSSGLSLQSTTDEIKKWRRMMELSGSNIHGFHKSVKRIVDVELSGDIKLRIYIPWDTMNIPKLEGGKDNTVTKPVLLWFHGGGWVLGGIMTDNIKCLSLANSTGNVIISVEYRLAPENPFPAAVDDADAALRWVLHNIGDYEGDNSNIVLAGESSGGNIAASLMTSYIANGPHKYSNIQSTHISFSASTTASHPIKGVVLIYPVLEFGNFRDSYFRYKNVNGFLTMDQMLWFWALYLGENQHQQGFHFRASPSRAPNKVLAQFPPTLLILAKFDVLLDEGIQFGIALRKNKVNATTIVFNNSMHGFFAMPGSRAGNDGKNVMTTFVKELTRR